MKQYLDLLHHIKKTGTAHSDRTGVTTRRVFGHQTRYDLSKGFPLLTTKKLSFRWIAEELFWFLSGDTSNKTLQEKGITIWNEWRIPYSLDRPAVFINPRSSIDGPVYDGDFSIAGFCHDKESIDGRLASVWVKMMKRCYDDSHHRYSLYGGSGTTVYHTWHNPHVFIEDAKKLPHWQYKKNNWNEFELDKDYFGSGQYGPSTSVWLRTDENNKYTRASKPITVSDNEGNDLTFLTINDASRSLGIPLTSLHRWFSCPPQIFKEKNKKYIGWKFEEAEVGGKLLRLKLIEDGDLGPIYGQAWRNFGASVSPFDGREDEDGKRIINTGFQPDGADQIKRLCNLLENNPDSRRMIVSGWNPKQCDNVALPPCHTLFHFAAEEQDSGPRKLHCQLYQRSADVFLGVPYNVASYSLLTMMLAHVHNMVPGDFVHTFGDLHIYANHFEQVDEQLGREPRSQPIVEIDETFRGSGFDGLMRMGYENLTLTGYNPHPSIKAPVAI